MEHVPDQLTKFIALVLPLKFNQLTQRIENDGEAIDGDFFGTHLQVHSDRIMKAMIQERLGASGCRRDCGNPSRHCLNSEHDH